MRKKILILAIAGLMFATTGNDCSCSQCVVRLGTSATEFQRYFNALRTSDSQLNPVQRFVYSLILANTRSAEKTS